MTDANPERILQIFYQTLHREGIQFWDDREPLLPEEQKRATIIVPPQSYPKDRYFLRDVLVLFLEDLKELGLITDKM
jgi:hypothetical protein